MNLYSPTEVVGAEMRHAGLRVGGGLDDDVVERGARGGHGDVVLLIDRAQVSQA